MTLDQFTNAAIVGCVLFLALLSLLKKNNAQLGYAFLSGAFIVLAFSFAGDLLENSAFLARHPKLTILFEPILFVLPPVIYLAVRHLTSITKLTLKVVYHFIPYLFLIGLYILSFLNQPQVTTSPSNKPAQEKLLEVLIFILFFIQMCSYLYHSIKLLKRHRETLPFFVSNLSSNDFHWLYNSILGLCVLTLNLFFEVLFDQPAVSLYFSMIYLLGFYYVGVQIAQQKDVIIDAWENDKQLAGHILPSETVSDEGLEDNPPNPLKMQDLTERKQVMSEENLNLCKIKLLNLIETERPFLDSELTLSKLGSLLQLNTYQTSYLINTCFGENFYVFINKYRLERCKKMLVDPRYNHLSILGIAFEAGFNSKTTFNTAFKKSTGLSPKAFRQQALEPGKKGSDLSTT